jgi:hypothetical protein
LYNINEKNKKAFLIDYMNIKIEELLQIINIINEEMRIIIIENEEMEYFFVTSKNEINNLTIENKKFININSKEPEICNDELLEKIIYFLNGIIENIKNQKSQKIIILKSNSFIDTTAINGIIFQVFIFFLKSFLLFMLMVIFMIRKKLLKIMKIVYLISICFYFPNFLIMILFKVFLFQNKLLRKLIPFKMILFFITFQILIKI